MRQIFAAAVLVAAASAQAATYEIDPAHSNVSFKVKHLVGRVPGHFGKFAGTIDYAPGKPATWKVEATIDPKSINTDNEKRDAHLQSPDFFDVAKCPEMSFKSTKVTDVKDDAAKLHGDLTMHCVTKPVVLDLEIGGVGKTPWGVEEAGFTAKGKINRKDFDIVWNKTLDNGGLMLGEDVEISIDVEAGVKQAAFPGKPAKAETKAAKKAEPAAKKP